MATPIRDAMINNSSKDGTGDAIEGSEVDANPNTIADLLDGTSTTVWGQAGQVSFKSWGIKEDAAAAGSIKDKWVYEWDPSDGSNLTDNSSGLGMVWKMPDDADNQTEFANLDIMCNDDAASSEDAEFVFSTVINATMREVFSVGSQGTTFNEDSQDLDFRIETDNIANGFIADAGLDVFSFGAAAADDKFVTISPPAATHTATNDTYALHVTAGGAQTIPSGTTALVASLAVEEPNITATGTVTNAATVYIKNAPTEGGTGNYALWIDAGASQLDGTLTVGVNDTGHDVKFFGATSGQYLLWDESADELVLAGDTKLSFHDAAGGENIIASADGHLEINAGTTLDITAPTVDLNSATEFNIDTAAYDLNASGAVTIDSAGVSIDSSSASNLTTSSGALTITSAAAATWSTSAGALTINGTGGVNIQEGGSTIIGVSDSRVLATTNTASVDLDATGAIQINSSGGVISVANDNVDQTVNLATAGTRTLNIGILDGTDTTTITSKGNQTHSGTITVGVDDTGYDVKFFGATASAYMLWDESADDLILAGAAGLIVPDNKLTLGSTAITTTAAEINLIDGGTPRGTDAVASGDGILINDAGTMKMTNVDTVSTYFSSHNVGGSNIVTTGALNSGSITSGFGTINNGSSTITTTGAVSTGALTSTGDISFDGGSFVFNESGADKDFRIEGDTNANLFVADASTDRVGIGASAPDALLEISGSGTGTASVTAGTQAIFGNTGTTGSSSRVSIVAGTAGYSVLDFGDTAVSKRGAVAYKQDEELMIFNTNTTDQMWLDSNGNVGVGTANPTISRVHASTGTAGDFAIRGTTTNTDRGVLLLENTNASFGDNLIVGSATRAATTSYDLMRLNSGAGADVEFLFEGNGDAYADGTWQTTGGDYQELFESSTGAALEVGVTVVMDGDKVRASTSDDSADDIMGVVRPKADNKNSAVVGNTAWNSWTDKYLTDDYGVYLREDIDVWTYTEEGDEKAVYARDQAADWVPPVGAVKSTESVRKLNPEYNKSQSYQRRKDRAEWNLIGLLGQIQLKKGEKVNSRWLKMKDISDAVELWYCR